MSGSWAMNMNDNAGITVERAMALAEIILRANQIMDGFLSRFPAPECKEQQEVVDAAKEWRGIVSRGIDAADAAVDVLYQSASTKVENN